MDERLEDPCEAIEPHLAGYALEALESDERAQVEIHLDGCPRCRATLADYQVVANGLLGAPLPIDPPARVRSRLITRIAPAEEKFGGGRRLFAFPIARALAVAALLLLVSLNVLLLLRTSALIEREQILLAQQQASQTALALASYPTSRVALVDTDQARGTFVYDPRFRVAVLYAWGLDPLPADLAYQIWLISSDGKRSDGGLFQASEDRRFTWIVVEAPAPLAEYVGFGVTIEPAGGSDSPTGVRVMGADF